MGRGQRHLRYPTFVFIQTVVLINLMAVIFLFPFPFFHFRDKGNRTEMEKIPERVFKTLPKKTFDSLALRYRDNLVKTLPLDALPVLIRPDKISELYARMKAEYDRGNDPILAPGFQEKFREGKTKENERFLVVVYLWSITHPEFPIQEFYSLK